MDMIFNEQSSNNLIQIAAILFSEQSEVVIDLMRLKSFLLRYCNVD